MSSEDQKRRQQSPPPPAILRRRHPYKTSSFSKPASCYIIGISLLILSFALGYISNRSNPLLLSQSAAAASDGDDYLGVAAEKRLQTPCPCMHPAPAVPSQSDNHELSGNDNEDFAAHNSFSSEKCASAVSSSPSHIRGTIIDRVFNGISPWEGFPPPQAKPFLQREWAVGWGSSAPVFEHLIRQVRPKTIIEVGTFLGASATHMAGLTRKLGLDETLIICIDDFRGWPGYEDKEKRLKMVNGDSMLLYQFMQNVVTSNVTESIMFLPFSTTTALGGLCQWGVYGDLVEIDAAHDFHSAWVDINNGYKVLRRPGGVIFGHDYVWPGVRRAVNLFARLNGFRVRKHGEHWILH